MSIGTRLRRRKELHFVREHESMSDILEDHGLAALGDAYVNLVYSLALSRRSGKPVGRKVDSSTLASALRKADLRKFLPSRTDRHKQADAAESLIVYAWLTGKISLEKTIHIVEKEESVEDAFSMLLQTVSKSLGRKSAI